MASPSARVAIIVNPISGAGAHSDAGRARVVLATAALHRHRMAGDVHVTQYAGHARVLARQALDAGASLVVAWGGDGTVNEVASEIAFSGASLAIVPSGSGNGLARDLAIPFAPQASLDIALAGRERLIDAGELDGRLFFNIAGVGFDARVAHEFAANGLSRRGFRRYLTIAARQLLTFQPDEHTIVADGILTRQRTLLVAVANGRQYGNGALIAPRACVDDGALDLVIVGYRSPARALLEVPALFAGRIERLPGVTMTLVREVEVTSARPVIFHVDGEPFVGSASLKARIRPKAVRVRVP